ncbi:MAG TPA: O-antigen ligase family protein [Dongiaceae bacterium]
MRATLNIGPAGAGGRSTKPDLGPLARGALALFFAFAATVVLLGLTHAPKRVSFVVLALILFLIAFALCGNRRLFFLWGLVLTVPLSVAKVFLVHAHMGGASGIYVDLCDFFLFPLLFYILRDYMRGFRPSLRYSAVLWWWGPMMLLGVIDIVVVPMRMLPFLEVVRMLKLYLLCFVIINEVVRVRQFMHLFAGIAAGIVLQATVCIVQFVTKANLGLQFLGEPLASTTKLATISAYLETHDVWRAGGLFRDPNLLAGYIALLLPMCIALLFSRINPVAKIMLGGIVAMGLAADGITLSRSGWLSFGAAFTALFGFSMLHQRMRLRYVLARVMVIISLLAAFGLSSGYILRRFFESDPGALSFRYDMMRIAWRMITDNPIFGLGLNTFVAHLPLYADPPGPEQVTLKYGPNWPVVHDSYLITWTEQGTVGFVLLVGLYLCILWRGFCTARRVLDDRISALALGATCGIIGIMVDGIGSFFVAEPAGARVFWLVVGTIMGLDYWTRANYELRGRQLRAAPAQPARVPA